MFFSEMFYWIFKDSQFGVRKWVHWTICEMFDPNCLNFNGSLTFQYMPAPSVFIYASWKFVGLAQNNNSVVKLCDFTPKVQTKILKYHRAYFSGNTIQVFFMNSRFDVWKRFHWIILKMFGQKYIQSFTDFSLYASVSFILQTRFVEISLGKVFRNLLFTLKFGPKYSSTIEMIFSEILF